MNLDKIVPNYMVIIETPLYKRTARVRDVMKNHGMIKGKSTYHSIFDGGDRSQVNEMAGLIKQVHGLKLNVCVALM